MADTAAPSAPETNGNDPTNIASWEGDKMFNIYIYDYCFKRGYRQTAMQLMREADIQPESKPPINARQGLLFEWWSVFWVLFTAKANGIGTDDALLYTQAQQSQRPRGAVPMQQGIPPPGQVPPRINGAMPNPHGPPQNRPGPLANPYMTNSMANAQHMQGMQGRPTPPGPPNFQPQQQRPGPGTGFLQQPNQAGPGQRIPAVNGGMPFDPSQAHRITPFPPPQGSGTPTPYPPLPQQQRPPSTSEELSMPQQSPRMHGAQVEAEFQKISPQSLRDLKSELNLGDKDSANLTQDDKHRLITLNRQRPQRGGQPSRPMPNAGPGPSTARRTNKRNSTSPGEEMDAVGNSPPNKKPRRSPAEQLPPNQQPPPPQNTNPSSNIYPSQPGGSQGPQPGMGQPMNNGMRPPPQPGFQGMPGMNGMNLNIPGSGQGNVMGHMMASNGGRNPTEFLQYNQTLQNVHRANMQLAQRGGNPAGSPPVFGQPGPPGTQQQHNQMSQQKGGMLPPPAPSPGKDGSTNNKPDASPRNQTGSAPPTPQQVPAPTPSPAAMLGQQQSQQQQASGSMPGGQSTANPGASLLGQPLAGGQTSNNNSMMGSAMMFNQEDFGLPGGSGGMMEEFDASLFRPDGDINFERDFGQWFNPEDLGGGLDMK